MKQLNWGGKREGAGRKKGDVIYKTISIVLPEEEIEILKEHAVKQNMTVSRFVSKYLGLDTYLQIQKENKTNTKKK
jgi:peroxiredoxin